MASKSRQLEGADQELGRLSSQCQDRAEERFGGSGGETWCEARCGGETWSDKRSLASARLGAMSEWKDCSNCKLLHTPRTVVSPAC